MRMIEQIVTSSVLITAILILSFFMEKRINPCIRYALWLCVAVKLLLPVPEVESPVSVMNAVNEIRESGVTYFSLGSRLEGKQGITEGFQGHGGIAEREIEAESEGGWQKFDFAFVCKSVWIFGALFCGGVFIWSNLRFAERLREKRVKIGRIKGRLTIYEAEGVRGPCLFGCFRPGVYLPKGLSGESRELVLVHEYTHYRHGDHVWALVRCLCVIFYWYHPLVWLAAHRSVVDGELACDAGTLRRIGREKQIEYGKTLIEMAKEMKKQYAGIPVLKCAADAAGGMREMRRRIGWIANQPRTRFTALFAMGLMVFGAVGCTFGAAVHKEETPAAKDVSGEESAELENVAADGDGQEAPPSPQGEPDIQTLDGMLYEGVALSSQPTEDQVYIKVQPSVLREYISYYYIPEDEDQEWLRDYMNQLSKEGAPAMRRWEGNRETGWQIVYRDKEYMAFEGGYLYYFYDDELGYPMEYYAEAKQLCDGIQAMLEEKLNYVPFDPSDIMDVVSAKLEICCMYTDNEFYSQTLTDPKILKMLEKWFQDADYIFGGIACGSQQACLELTLESGEVVRLSLASDSCSVFSINGVAYNYRPSSDWYNENLLALFDEIPWEF